jgi:hypothetical protein
LAVAVIAPVGVVDDAAQAEGVGDPEAGADVVGVAHMLEDEREAVEPPGQDLAEPLPPVLADVEIGPVV